MNEPDQSQEFDLENLSLEATAETDPAATTADGEQAESRDEEIERLRATADGADKRVLLAQAEVENVRKRLSRDYQKLLKYASEPLVVDFLVVRDNLIRALEAAESSTDSDGLRDGLRDGVAIVVKQLDDTLAKHDVREIPAAGETFDPNYHEAISYIPSDEHASGKVAVVAVTGFQMHDRVVRPSQVVVSSGPAEKNA